MGLPSCSLVQGLLPETPGRSGLEEKHQEAQDTNNLREAAERHFRDIARLEGPPLPSPETRVDVGTACAASRLAPPHQALGSGVPALGGGGWVVTAGPGIATQTSRLREEGALLVWREMWLGGAMTWVTSISFWTGVVPSQTCAQQGLLVQVWSRAGKGDPGAYWEVAAGGGPWGGRRKTTHSAC